MHLQSLFLQGKLRVKTKSGSNGRLSCAPKQLQRYYSNAVTNKSRHYPLDIRANQHDDYRCWTNWILNRNNIRREDNSSRMKETRRSTKHCQSTSRVNNLPYDKCG